MGISLQLWAHATNPVLHTLFLQSSVVLTVVEHDDPIEDVMAKVTAAK